MQCSTAVLNAVAVVVTWTLQHNEIGLVHPSSVLWSWIPIVQTAAAVAVRHLLTGQQQIGACTILDTQQTTNNKQQQQTTTTNNNNNKQQQTTTNNNKQQQTTTNNNNNNKQQQQTTTTR